jgi:hypothetical protein
MLDVEENRRAQKYSPNEMGRRICLMLLRPLFRFSPRPFFGWRKVLVYIAGLSFKGYLPPMTTTVEAYYHDGKLILPQPLPLPDNTRVRIVIDTNNLAPDVDRTAWLKLSEQSLTAAWNNPEDDAFDELLSK